MFKAMLLLVALFSAASLRADTFSTLQSAFNSAQAADLNQLAGAFSGTCAGSDGKTYDAEFYAIKDSDGLVHGWGLTYPGRNQTVCAFDQNIVDGEIQDLTSNLSALPILNLTNGLPTATWNCDSASYGAQCSPTRAMTTTVTQTLNVFYVRTEDTTLGGVNYCQFNCRMK